MIFPLCPRARQRRKEARPGELLSAALEVFAERGFAATKLDDVAKRAGVSKGTVYLYFDSKEALFKAAVETAIAPALEAAEALATDTTKPPAEVLRTFVLGWWQMVGATPLGALPKLLVAESGNFPELAAWFHDTVIRRAQRAGASIIEFGIARGDFRPVDAMQAARIVFAPMFSYILWRRSFAECMKDLPDPDTYFTLAVDILVNGLTAPKESAQ
jgi:AcrR family transcriptional regulator